MKRSNLLNSINKAKIEYLSFQFRVGANVAINYKKENDLPKAILDATEGKGVNIILDCVGAQWAAMVTISP